MNVTIGQLTYEASLLLSKLHDRNIKKYEELKTILTFETHPNGCLWQPYKNKDHDRKD